MEREKQMDKCARIILVTSEGHYQFYKIKKVIQVWTDPFWVNYTFKSFLYTVKMNVHHNIKMVISSLFYSQIIKRHIHLIEEFVLVSSSGEIRVDKGPCAAGGSEGILTQAGPHHTGQEGARGSPSRWNALESHTNEMQTDIRLHARLF